MNCDLIAPWYWLMERAAFGELLTKCRGEFLPRLKHSRRVLVLGDGDGRALSALLKICPQAHVDYVDLSERMLAIAQKRVANLGLGGRVTFLCGDALTIPWPHSEYDSVITHFFLDCLDENGVESLATRIACSSAADAIWITSEFQDAGIWRRALVGFLYLFFRISTGLRVNRLTGYREILQRNGFHNAARKSHGHGLLVSELWFSNKSV